MTDIQELFARDPLSLSKGDRRTIIEKQRELRKGFNSAGVPAKAPKTASKAKADLAPDVEIKL